MTLSCPNPTVYLCPNCAGEFCVDTLGGAYGLHPPEFDDTFFILVCSHCALQLHREAVRLKTTARFLGAVMNCDQNTRFAITTLKILTIYGHDIRLALENGWPFEHPGHHYDVCELPFGIFVSERGTSHAD